jgi:hypothetical protein
MKCQQNMENDTPIVLEGHLAAHGGYRVGAPISGTDGRSERARWQQSQ